MGSRNCAALSRDILARALYLSLTLFAVPRNRDGAATNSLGSRLGTMCTIRHDLTLTPDGKRSASESKFKNRIQENLISREELYACDENNVNRQNVYCIPRKLFRRISPIAYLGPPEKLMW